MSIQMPFARMVVFITLAFCAPPCAFAAVLTVGSGGMYGKIQNAVYAASDGDTLLIISADHFTELRINNKSLTIVADTGVDVVISGGISVQHLAPGKRVMLKGLKNIDPGGYDLPGLHLLQNEGSIRIENCDFYGSRGENEYGHPDYRPHGWDGVLVQFCADVAFAYCTMNGGPGADVWYPLSHYPVGDGGHALSARSSTIACYNCTLRGGRGGNCEAEYHYSGGNGGNGYESPDAYLFASKCKFYGGHAGFGGDNPSGPAGDGGDGGHGIYLNGTSAAQAILLGASTQAGSGGTGGLGSPSGSDGSSGLEIQAGAGVVTFLTGTTPRSFHMSSPVRETERVNMNFLGQQDELAVLFVSIDPANFFVGNLHGQWLVGLSPAFMTVIMGTIPKTNKLIVPVVIPQLSPGLESTTVYLQSLFTDGSTHTLGTPRTLVVLDTMF